LLRCNRIDAVFEFVLGRYDPLNFAVKGKKPLCVFRQLAIPSINSTCLGVEARDLLLELFCPQVDYLFYGLVLDLAGYF